MRSGIVAVLVAAAAGRAYGDQRSLAHTYEYSTVPEGNTTFDLWNTQTRATAEAVSPQLYQGVLEIEHGITEHLDVGVVTVFEQVGAAASEPLHLAQTRLESRVRFAERAEWPVDTALYAAAAKRFGESSYLFEARIIGARDAGDISVAANAIASLSVGRDAPDEGVAFGWGAGATYQAHDAIRVGVESWGTLVDGDLHASIGPALGISPSSKLWAAVTVGLGLTDEPRGVAQGYVSARAIIGIEL